MTTFANERYACREFAAAAAFFLDASRLTSNALDGTERHWRAVDCWLDAGDVQQARTLADSAPRDGAEPRRNLALGRLSLAAGRFDEARQRLCAVLDESSSTKHHVDWRLIRNAATELGHMSLVEGCAADAILGGTRGLLADPTIASTNDDVVGLMTAARGIAGETEQALAGVA